MVIIASSITIGMLFHGVWTLLTRPYAEPHTPVTSVQ